MKSWSNSKSQALLSCKRRYYFNYFLNARLNSRDKLLREIAFLKKLKNIYLWKGEIFHNLIADWLSGIRRGSFSDLDMILQKADEIIKYQWEYSSSKKYLLNKKEIGNGVAVALMEHEYNEGNQSGTIDNVIQEITIKLKLFYEWIEEYKLIEALKNAKQVWIEPPLFGAGSTTFFIDGIKVFNKVDLAIENTNGNINIYDWKTGKPNSNNPYSDIDQYEFQVAIYQLWPYFNFSKSLDLIEGELLFFDENGYISKKYTIDENKKEYILELIRKSINQISEFDDVLNNEDTSLDDMDFPLASGLCKLCSFKRICRGEFND